MCWTVSAKRSAGTRTTADVVPVIDAVCGADFGWVVGQDVQVDAGFLAGVMSGATVPAGR